MRQVIETYYVYKYSELPEEIKQKVIESPTFQSLEYEWWDSCYEMFREDFKELGIEVDSKHPFFFDLGRSQSFELNKPRLFDSSKLLSSFLAQTDYKLGHISSLVHEGLNLNVSHCAMGRQGYSFSIDSYGSHNHRRIQSLISDLEEGLNDWFRNRLADCLRTLEKECEYQTSREYIEESIDANDYEFTEDGEIA